MTATESSNAEGTAGAHFGDELEKQYLSLRNETDHGRFVQGAAPIVTAILSCTQGDVDQMAATSSRSMYEVVDSARSILATYFDRLSPPEVLVSHQADLLKALASAPEELREIVGDQLARLILRCPDAAGALLCGDCVAVSIALLRLYTDEQAGSRTAASAKRALMNLFIGHSEKLLVNREFAREFTSLVSSDTKEQTRFKAYDLYVDVVTEQKGTDGGGVLGGGQSPLLTALVAELTTDDVLVQLNVLELLGRLSRDSAPTAVALRDAGVLDRLHQMLVAVKEAPDSGFIFPALIRFFGYLAREQPKECCSAFPAFLESLIHLILHYDSIDVSQRLLAFDTLAVIGSTVKGKRFLAEHDAIMQKCMRCFGEACRSGPNEVKLRHLEALAELLTIPAGETEMSATIEHWFSCLSANSDMTSILFGWFRQPLPDVHRASGAVIDAVATQPWAQRLLQQTPGFLEYLLNRETCTDNDSRHLRFEIVSKLVNSPVASEVFSGPELLKLREYYHQGPFYVRTHTEVAVEGD